MSVNWDSEAFWGYFSDKNTKISAKNLNFSGKILPKIFSPTLTSLCLRALVAKYILLTVPVVLLKTAYTPVDMI